MSDARTPLGDRAAELRRQFDRAFVEARPPDPPASVDLLAIRLGGERYALRLAEIAGLFVGMAVTAIPGHPLPLRGVAGFRGAVTPVYDLAAMLGYPPVEPLRWLVTAAQAPVAFALSGFDGHRRVPCEAVTPRRGDEARRHVRAVARTADFALPVVTLALAIAAVTRRPGDPSPREPEPC